MRLRLGPYFVKQAVNNILNNRLIHSIGISTMVVCLLIFGTFLLLFVNVNNWIRGWGESLSMSVYLKDDINKSERQQLVSLIRTLPSAEITQFISKEEAWKELHNALGPHSGLLEGLSGNPLPASIEVGLKGVTAKEFDPAKIKKKIEGMAGVDEVHYSEEWFERFEALMNVFRYAGIAIGGLLCLGVLFVVTNTIGLTLYSRREEIEIIQLVGGTDWFIRIPYLLEGLFQGLLSGVFALAVLFLGYCVISTKEMHLLGLAMLDFTFLPYEYIIGMLCVSVLLGLMGSFIALGRFFRI